MAPGVGHWRELNPPPRTDGKEPHDPRNAPRRPYGARAPHRLGDKAAGRLQGGGKGERCVPLPPSGGDGVDARVLAERLGMPLVRDEAAGLWCLGPEAGGRALASVEAPDLELPDLDGRPFRLGDLRGKKVLLYAWASW